MQRKDWFIATFRGLRVCVLGIRLGCAKTVKLIKTPFVGADAFAKEIHVLNEGAYLRHRSNTIE